MRQAARALGTSPSNRELTTYAGFDRVVDQKWHEHGASADRDRYTYAYDRAGNRVYGENTLTSRKDEYYT